MSEEPDADIAIEAPGQVIHLDAELEEDIGAEIEDLILLRRLGYNRDAWEVITEVLLRHIRHFPVFAEVSAYLAYRGDDRMLDNLCSCLQLTDSTSTWNAQEIAYFQHVVDSGQGPLVLDLDVSKKDVPLDPVSVCVPGLFMTPTVTDNGYGSYNSLKCACIPHLVKASILIHYLARQSHFPRFSLSSLRVSCGGMQLTYSASTVNTTLSGGARMQKPNSL